MANKEKHSRTQRIGLIEQTTWRTAEAASSAFLTTNYNAGVSIPEPNIIVNNFNWTSAVGAMPESARKYIDAKSQLKTLNFEGTLTKALLAPHVYAALQGFNSEGATTPYAKDFSILDDPDIDFANGEGKLHTLGIDNYQGTDGLIFADAILNTLTFRFNNNGSGIERLASIAGEWIGTAISYEQDLSGTWAAQPTSGFFNTASESASTDFNFSTFTIGGASIANICWRNFEVTINNNVRSDCKTTGGVANNYKLVQDVTYTIDIPYNEQTWIAFRDWKDGDAVVWKFQNGAGTTDGEVSFEADDSVLTANPFVYEGDYQAIRLQGQILRDGSGTNFHIKFSDAIDWAY